MLPTLYKCLGLKAEQCKVAQFFVCHLVLPTPKREAGRNFKSQYVQDVQQQDEIHMMKEMLRARFCQWVTHGWLHRVPLRHLHTLTKDNVGTHCSAPHKTLLILLVRGLCVSYRFPQFSKSTVVLHNTLVGSGNPGTSLAICALTGGTVFSMSFHHVQIVTHSWCSTTLTWDWKYYTKNRLFISLP